MCTENEILFSICVNLQKTEKEKKHCQIMCVLLFSSSWVFDVSESLSGIFSGIAVGCSPSATWIWSMNFQSHHSVEASYP